MKTFLNRVRQFLTSEDGPTAVEYAVMLALIVVACIAVVQGLGQIRLDHVQQGAEFDQLDLKFFLEPVSHV